MSNPYPHWIDKAEEELTKSYQEGTINYAFIGNVMDAAKEAAIQEKKILEVDLGMCNHELAVARDDLNWYREQHALLLHRLSQTGQALAAKQNELLSTTAILGATLPLVGASGATVPQGKYDELENKYFDTRAAFQMMSDENRALKIECETYKKDLGPLRRDNERLNKELRASKAAKEGTSSNP